MIFPSLTTAIEALGTPDCANASVASLSILLRSSGDRSAWALTPVPRDSNNRTTAMINTKRDNKPRASGIAFSLRSTEIGYDRLAPKIGRRVGVRTPDLCRVKAALYR